MAPTRPLYCFVLALLPIIAAARQLHPRVAPARPPSLALLDGSRDGAAVTDGSSMMRLRGGADEHGLTAQVLSEVLGTFLLLVSVRLSSKVPPFLTRPVQLPVLCTLGSIIFFLGPIGGASLNPAVNLALLIAGEMSTLKFILYGIAQMIGAAAATKLIGALFP